ncbi:T9SS type A sorting domain-containing protein, partial [Bacteroidota bacterium]
ANLKNQNPKIQSLDTLPPEPKWYMDCSGSVNAWKEIYVHDKPDNPSIRSNLFSITLDTGLSYNYKLQYGKFSPCYHSSTRWSLSTIDRRKDAYAVVTFADCAGNDTTVYIEYIAPKIILSESSIHLGSLKNGERSQRKIKLINYSETRDWECTQIMLLRKDIMGLPQGFDLTSEDGFSPLSLPLTLQPLDTFTFAIQFYATKEGEFWDSIGFGNNCMFWCRTRVEANVGTALIQVSDWHFPLTLAGDSAGGEFAINNSGMADLKIIGYDGPFLIGKNSGEAIYESRELKDMGISADNPLVIKQGEESIFHIQFSPDDSLDHWQDSIIFISNSAIADTLSFTPDYICFLDGSSIISDVYENIEKIKIYPNPADDKIVISGIKEGNISVKIIDILGNEIYSEELLITNDQLLINTKEFPEGIYLMQIMTYRDIITRKFLILR